jgi:hypothetical protein
MTAPTTTPFRVGDKVSIAHHKYPGIWVIESFGPVNALVKPEGGGRGLRVPRSMLTAPGETDLLRKTAPVYFSEGDIVQITSGRFIGLYVVISDKGADRINVAKLGGDGGRYVRTTRTGLVKLSLSELAEVL